MKIQWNVNIGNEICKLVDKSGIPFSPSYLQEIIRQYEYGA